MLMHADSKDLARIRAVADYIHGDGGARAGALQPQLQPVRVCKGALAPYPCAARAARMSLSIKTPLLESLPLSQLNGTRVLMKMESAQPSGSFKIRGIGCACE
jgi:hypothetical protein